MRGGIGRRSFSVHYGLPSLGHIRDGLKGLRTLRGMLAFGEAHGCALDLSWTANSGHILGRRRGLSRHRSKPVFARTRDHWHRHPGQMLEVTAWKHRLAGLASWIIEQTSC